MASFASELLLAKGICGFRILKPSGRAWIATSSKAGGEIYRRLLAAAGPYFLAVNLRP